jgi:hypothetical protein
MKSLRDVRVSGDPECASPEIQRVYFGVLAVVAAVRAELSESHTRLRDCAAELRALLYAESECPHMRAVRKVGRGAW